MPRDYEDGNCKARRGTLSRLFLYNPFLLRLVSAAVRRGEMKTRSSICN